MTRNYDKTYVVGEYRSSEYNKQIKQELKLYERYSLLNKLNQKLPNSLLLNKTEKMLVRNLIETFNNNFKYLHRQLGEESIILAFIFYIKKINNPSLKCEDYAIWKEYGLTINNLLLIICRIAHYYQCSSPLPIKTTYRGDHDELIRGKYPSQ